MTEKSNTSENEKGEDVSSSDAQGEGTAGPRSAWKRM